VSLKSPGKPFSVRSTQLDPNVSAVGDVPLFVDDNTQDVEVKLSPIDAKSQELSDESPSLDLAAIKIESKRVIPYSTVHIQGHQVAAVQDLLTARHLEGKLDDAITTQLYASAEGPDGSPDLIVSANEKVDQELEVLEKKIAAVNGLKMMYEQIDAVFRKNDQLKDITELMKENVAEFGLDPITADEIEESDDYQQIIHEFTRMSISAVKNKLSITRRYLQCLHDAQWALSMGASVSFFIPANSRIDPVKAKRAYSDGWMQGVRHKYPGLKSLGTIGLSKNPNFDGLLGVPQKRLPDLGTMLPIQQVAYYSTILSRELLLSAGLGRLEGTILGQTYSAAREAYHEQLLGTKAITGGASHAAPPANSLANFALVKEDGSLNTTVGPGKKVYFLEGGAAGVSKKNNTTNSKRQWIDTIKDDPFNNNMDIFDATVQQATDRFTNAQEFLSTLLCRDQERTLLSPRGLFTRILKDFSVLLGAAALPRGGDSTEDKRDALAELAVLEAASRTEIPVTFVQSGRDLGDLTSETRGDLRRNLTFYLGRKLLNRRKSLASLQAEADAAATPTPTGPTGGGSSAPDTGNQMRMTSSNELILKATSEATHTERRLSIADALVLLAGASRPRRSAGIYRRGHKIAHSIFASGDHGEGNIETIILKIYEDLEAEAWALATVDGKSQSSLSQGFLRERGLTSNAAFDGMICLSMLLECFIQLTRALADVKLVLKPSTKNLRTAYIDVKKRNAVVPITSFGGEYIAQEHQRLGTEVRTHFKKNRQELYYPLPGRSGDLDRIQKFIKELVAASESDDLSALIDADGAVPAVAGLKQNTQLGPTDEVTPLSLIEMMEKLALEDDVSVILFSIARSFIDNMSMKSAPLSQKATALKSKSLVDAPDDMIILREMRDSKLNSDFLKAMSDSQMKWATTRVETLKNASEDGYMINKTNSDLFKAYHMLLEEKKNEFTNGAILFVGLPNGAIEDEVSAKELDENKAVMELEIDKIDESNPHIEFREKKKDFLLKCSTNGMLISEAMAQEVPPTTFSELVTAVKFNFAAEPEPITGDEIIFQSSNPTRTRGQLIHELESFVFKQMYQELTDFSFNEEMIQFDPLVQRSNRTMTLSRALMRPMGLDDSTIDRLFVKRDSEIGLPNKLRLDKLIQSKEDPERFQIGPDGSLVKAWTVPLMSPSQLDAFYGLFATKPFFADKVEDFVLSKTIFDRVYAVFVDLDDFEIDEKASLHSYRMVYWRRGGKYRRQRWWRSKRDFKSRRPPGSFSLPALYVGAKLV